MLLGVNELEHDGCGCLSIGPRDRRLSLVVCRLDQRPKANSQRRGLRLQRSRGFTLLELMIVLSIIMILMAVAVPMYNQSIIQARESVLRSNLSTLRSVISQYTLDKQKAPQSLDDLVTAGYLRQIPVDPMTRQTNWEVVQEDVMLAVDQQDPGITDVHSASSATASDGSAYSTW
jgi:general secretion pathway protein G